jgi:glycerophosphoryl diester phosphodiesterase
MFFVSNKARPLVIAHRGGGGLWPENTLLAFDKARMLGVDVIETDVHSTSDGVLVMMHDATVDRTTNGTGRIQDMTFAQLRQLDAGYRWTNDNGRTFPYRGKGLVVPTVEEAFKAQPDMRFNIEPKQSSPSINKPLCELLRNKRMVDRVVIGSFSAGVLEEFRSICPEVATSASPAEVSQFLAMQRSGVATAYSPPMQALQVPEYWGGMQVVTKSFVEAAHNRKLQVHVWTVNDVEDMKRLLGEGVDGIMTDYPDRLLELLNRRAAK